MNDLYNTVFELQGDVYFVDFSDGSLLHGTDGSNGALFNLSESNKRWNGAGTVGSDTFVLPDLTQLSLDNFAEQTVAFLSEGYDYGLVFEGTDQMMLSTLRGLMTALTSSRRATLMLDRLHYLPGQGHCRPARFMKRTMEIWLLR